MLRNPSSQKDLFLQSGMDQEASSETLSVSLDETVAKLLDYYAERDFDIHTLDENIVIDLSHIEELYSSTEKIMLLYKKVTDFLIERKLIDPTEINTIYFIRLCIEKAVLDQYQLFLEGNFSDEMQEIRLRKKYEIIIDEIGRNYDKKGLQLTRSNSSGVIPIGLEHRVASEGLLSLRNEPRYAWWFNLMDQARAVGINISGYRYTGKAEKVRDIMDAVEYQALNKRDQHSIDIKLMGDLEKFNRRKKKVMDKWMDAQTKI